MPGSIAASLASSFLVGRDDLDTFFEIEEGNLLGGESRLNHPAPVLAMYRPWRPQAVVPPHAPRRQC